MRKVIRNWLRGLGLAWQLRFDWPRPLPRGRYEFREPAERSVSPEPGDQEPSSDYSVVRHASILDAPGPSEGLSWVVVAHWRFQDGTEEWYTEYWDHRFNEEAGEELHGSEAEAITHAENRFGRLNWTAGGPPR
jgi:hypothetical protein